MATPFVPAAAALLLAVTGAAQIFPAPVQPAGNPSTPQKELLGKALFWDEQLSATRTMACGTCHVFSRGGVDPRAGALHPGADGQFGTLDDVRGSFGVVLQNAAHRYVGSPAFGIARQVTNRKAPSPINAAYQPELTWDGRARAQFVDPLTGLPVLAADAALESQASGPPISDVEMSHLGRTWADIAADLPGLVPLALATNVPQPLQTFIAGQTYAQLFQLVYGSPGVTPVRIIFAIAAYERTLVSDRSPYDLSFQSQYTLTPTEQIGLQRFTSLCMPCHTDVDPLVFPTSGPVLTTFRNIGVRPNSEDPGRFLVTQQASDMGRFKVPGLRNVALRAPYFHNGGMPTLTAVLDFYGFGGHFHSNQDPLVANIVGQLSPVDKPRVVAFLNTLTDPRVQNELPPFDRPRLWSEGPHVPTTFGTGTAGSGGLPPRASAVPPPYVGNPAFTLGVDRTAPGAFSFLVFDFAANTTPTNLFGHSVYLAQTPAMTSLAGQGLTLGAGPGGGFSSFTFALPNYPGLAGVSLFGQWLIVDALGPVGFGSSDAFGLTIF